MASAVRLVFGMPSLEMEEDRHDEHGIAGGSRRRDDEDALRADGLGRQL
jgi:hypothetical protein